MISFLFSLLLIVGTGVAVYFLGIAEPLNWLLIPPVIAACFFLLLGRLPRPRNWRPETAIRHYNTAKHY